MHKLSNILISRKSTYGSRETELYSGARRMFWEARMCLQTIYSIYATKGEITGMITRAMVIFINQFSLQNAAATSSGARLGVRTLYFQNIL